MANEYARDEHVTIERAFTLAETGRFPDVQSIIRRLQSEGHVTALTDLRSRYVRSDLRRLCKAARTPGALSLLRNT